MLRFVDGFYVLELLAAEFWSIPAWQVRERTLKYMVESSISGPRPDPEKTSQILFEFCPNRFIGPLFRFSAAFVQKMDQNTRNTAKKI